MPFSNIKKIMSGVAVWHRRVSLQVQRSIIQFIQKIKQRTMTIRIFWKRVHLFTSRGSITIEAALSMTLFLGMVMFIMSFMVAVNIQQSMQIAMNNTANSIAKNMFYVCCLKEVSDSDERIKAVKEKAAEVYASKENTKLQKYIAKGMDMGVLAAELAEEMDHIKINDSPIIGGVTGMYLGESRIEEHETDIVLQYRIRIPFVRRFLQICQRAYVKNWTGRDLTEQIPMVYITKNGTVYHRSRTCRHLKIQITKTTFAEVKGLRNESGAMYKKCSECGGDTLTARSTVFVTKEGNRYHSHLECGGLTRTIMVIPMTEVGEKRECQDCKGGTS